MNKLVIIHFSPLEMYPPVQNLLNLLGESNGFKKIVVVTTHNKFKELDTFVPAKKNIRIIYLGNRQTNPATFFRLINYLRFYMGCLLRLIIEKPVSILYYETLSAFPVYLYRRYVNKKVKVFIHYHEYTSPAEYNNGMRLNKYFHSKENWLYEHSEWISHTNKTRLFKFQNDILPVKINNPQVLPNYPPKSWIKSPVSTHSFPLKIVYTGSLSMDTMFTREFALWVNGQNGKVRWDIYSYNVTNDTNVFLESLNSKFIELRSGVNYNNLPDILRNYDVGIILYKGHIPNYVYNAPNKLFEYMACGLDVWFPEVMEEIFNFISRETYPKVLPINLASLDKFNLEGAINKEGYSVNTNSFICENVLQPLCTALQIT